MSGDQRAIRSVELVRPTVRGVVPFLSVALLGMVVPFLPPYGFQGSESLVMVAVFLVASGFMAVSIRRPVRTWVDPVAPLVYLLVIALGRDLTGGSASGMSPLVALPVLWLAMTGTRRDLWVAGLVTAAVFVVPIFLIGDPDYPTLEWRKAVLWTAFALILGPAVQRIVRQLETETLKERKVRAELDGVMNGARLSSMITTDLHGRITSFGVGSTELLGYAADEVVGRHDPGLFHDEVEVQDVAEELGVEAGFGVFAELARRNEPSRTWTYIRKDRTRLFVRLAVTELRDREGRVVGYLGVAIDTTAAVESKRALAQSELRWRVLADHLPDTTLLLVGEDLRIRLVAGAGAMRQGFKHAQGRPLGEMSKPENMAVLEVLLVSAFSGKEASGELTATHTGAEHEVVVTPLPPDDAGPQALIIARDVSKDRARERQVVHAKERAERLFADAPHGIAVLTTTGVVVQANAALRSMTGPVPGGLEGILMSGLSARGDDRFDRHLREVLAHRDERAESDWSLRRVDGTTIHVVLSSRVLAELDSADDTVLVSVVDVSERYQLEQRLAHQADHDVLTGLANRRKFSDELARHLARGERYGHRGALLVLDLDHFKEVNDTLGHGAGDELIIATAHLLTTGLRATDIVARLGGDEFAVLLADTDLEGAEVVARSIVDRIRDYTSTLDGARRRVTASVGVVGIGADAGPIDDLLAAADLTMYDAKDAGRDQHVALNQSFGRQSRTGERLEWKGRLERAIENDGFVLHLQPILDLSSGTVRSAEVLVRLVDGDELVEPVRFIGVAEKAGLMPSLDAWVVEHSIELLSRLHAHVPDFSLEVNLSGLSIGDPRIESLIVASLRRYEVDPRNLILEITETAAVANVEMAQQFAERMSTLGCQFALDDFGAGFGSFYYLKHLIFDYVKIDGEFVANCHRSSIDRTILRSIVGIARDLGKKTVAEYVANADVLATVREEGVDLAQGFHVGKPVAFDDFVVGLTSQTGGSST